MLLVAAFLRSYGEVDVALHWEGAIKYFVLENSS